MNTSEREPCRRCGVLIPETFTEQLCPACLLSEALELTGSKAETLPSTRESVATSSFSKFPCRFGGYRLLGLLGRGGMGTVYEAEQLATGRRVALKMLTHQLDSPDLRQRFLREGRLAASINHPNSLYIFGSEEIDSVPVITMEIAGSGTLKDKLKKRGAFSVTEAVDVTLEVIAGLEEAFAAGVLHRDVKPSNCFISPDGSVKVGDFGLSVSTLAREDSYVTATGVVMGTPAYASPEQLRGDELDLRTDIYSVGATLFTLLTNQAPFEGENAVQVVTNVVSRRPKALTEFRQDVPPGLERVIARCLSKEAHQRYPDYKSLREALLPFSSREPEPASMKVRAAAGWIDYLIAFLIPYVVLVLSVGNEEFHFRFLMERTLYSARHYLAFLGFGLLYFTMVEGIWGAGVGKHLKGLRVVRPNGQPAGIGRALIRILVPILSIEAIRIPLLMRFIYATHIDELTTFEIVIYSAASSLCPLIPLLFLLTAQRETGFTTVWDLASGTRVVIKPEGTVRPLNELTIQPELPEADSESLGPFKITSELVPERWLVAVDPVLRRQIWLLRRSSSEPSFVRRNLARPGRLRWLQEVGTNEAIWDAFEAPQGVPFSSWVEGGRVVPWSSLRHWLHDLATELWAARGDQTLPKTLSQDQVWITKSGQAVLMDHPWPSLRSPAKEIIIRDVTGQQNFLHSIADHVDLTGLPLHARPVLENLKGGKFEKVTFLTGILRGLLDKPADVGKGIRAASIFVLPLYIWIMVFVGTYRGADWLYQVIGSSIEQIALATTLLVLIGSAVIQLLALPFRTTIGHSIFRLALVNAAGKNAEISRRLLRWGIVWLPLLAPLSFMVLLTGSDPMTASLPFVVGLLLMWLGAAAYSVLHPCRGLHDRLAGTWVVRR